MATTSTTIRIMPKTHDCTKNLFKILRLVGILWPEEIKVWHIVHIIITKVLLLLLPICFALSFFVEKLAISNLLASLQLDVNAHACVIRVAIFVFNRKIVVRMETILDKLDSRMRYPEEIQEAENIIRFGNRIVIFFQACYLLYSTITSVGALFSGRPPYGLYIPFLNWRNSLLSLAIVSAIEFVMVNLGISQQMTNDVLPVIYIVLFNSHLKMLIMRVVKIGWDTKATLKDNTAELIECIRDHKNIIELIDVLEPVLSASIFVQFVASTAALVASLVNITLSTDNNTLYGSLAYIFCLGIEIFWLCYFVTTLTSTGLLLPDAIFEMNWMDQDMEFRKMSLFFMQRSQKEISLCAGKLFPISLNTFVSINKFAFSLYTLLKAMDIGVQFN